MTSRAPRRGRRRRAVPAAVRSRDSLRSGRCKGCGAGSPEGRGAARWWPERADEYL